MSRSKRSSRKRVKSGEISEPTGVAGLDRILSGGYPSGRVTIIRGASGAGKTILGLTFACQPGTDKAGVVVATFDESPDALRDYIRNLGLPGAGRVAKGAAIVDLRPDVESLNTGGTFELGGMMARIALALDKTGATRLVFDSFDNLFFAFENKARIHAELRRIFDWCIARGVTLIATCREVPDDVRGTMLADYASDCIVRLGQTVRTRLMTRTLHVQKCRGRRHGTNEYPFLIDERGITVAPVSETRLSGKISKRRYSTGISALDAMLGGKGVFQGSATLVSGQSGTGKSLFAATMAAASCDQGRRVHYLTFEESPDELMRNTRSIGLELRRHVKSGRLTTASLRSVEYGLEEHLIRIVRAVEDTEPDVLILDPISTFVDIGATAENSDVKAMLLRLAAFLKGTGVTTVVTELLPDSSGGVSTMNISSLIDTWIRLRLVERHGEFNRLVHVAKSRGAPSTNQLKEFRITDRGIVIEEPYVGPDGIEFGTVKHMLIAREERAHKARQREIHRLELELERERLTLGRQAELERQRTAQRIADLEAKIDELRDESVEAERSRM